MEETKTDFKTEDWQKFQKSIKVRNRITHPKRIEDLLVTYKEIIVVKESYSWAVGIFNKLLDSKIL